MSERWKAVDGFPGYEVSDLGRVRSIDRIVVRKDGRKIRCRGKDLALKVDSTGYVNVSLYRDGQRGGTPGGVRKYPVSAVVLEAFVGPRPEGQHACHNDGDTSNNRLDNLRWDTPSENAFDKVRHGRHPQASKIKCPQGHEYTEENTYRTKQGWRVCRQCRK